MKIVAGLGSIDDYITFTNAGADEMFCGYVPQWWNEKYGIYAPLNRREVLYYNVQIGSRSEMEILGEMIRKNQVPVSITLNALYYTPDQYPLILTYLEECLELGFSSFIIADLGLIVYIRQSQLSEQVDITVSGELAEMNTEVCEFLEEMDVKRIIFHRKMMIEDIRDCITRRKKPTDNVPMSKRKMEYEAFILNEKCHFHGGFCNSLHCDELSHMCQVPYILGAIDEKRCELYRENLTLDYNYDDESETYVTGESGCGICALWDLYHAGITHLKVVGRGNYSEDMENDIRALVLARKLLKESKSRSEYMRRVKGAVFKGSCSKNCYYEEINALQLD